MEVNLFMSNRSKEQEWQAHIAECQLSGMSVRQWCQINRISINQYHYWKRKLNAIKTTEQTSKTEWASLTLSDSEQSRTQNPPLILHIHHYKIELREGFDPNLLDEVLKVIGGLCC